MGDVFDESKMLTLADILVGSPQLPAMDEDTLTEQGTYAVPTLADVDEAISDCNMQDSPLFAESIQSQYETLMQEMLTSMQQDTTVPAQVNDLNSARGINPSLLQRDGTGPNRQDPFALPSLGPTTVPTSPDYENLPLPPLPLFSGPPPPIPPKSSYRALPSRPAPSVPSALPVVRPKGGTQVLAGGILRSRESPRSVSLRSRFNQAPACYQRQPFRNRGTLGHHADVEDLAWDHSDLNDCALAMRHAEVRVTESNLTEIPSPLPNLTEVSREDVEMNFRSPQDIPARRSPPDPVEVTRKRCNSSASASAAHAEKYQRVAKSADKMARQQEGPVKESVKIELTVTKKNKARPSTLAARAERRRQSQEKRKAQRQEPVKVPIQIPVVVSHQNWPPPQAQRDEQQHRREPIKGPIIIPLCGRQGDPADKLTTARATARANIGTSGYIPRGKDIALEFETAEQSPQSSQNRTD